MTTYFWIGLGSALGGISRFWLSGVIVQRYGESFPLGTLAVNVTGSFLIGLVAALGDSEGRLFVPDHTRQFLMTGILGGYTTFSAFSLQTLNLMREGEWLYAGMNIGLSIVLCLGTVWLGHVFGQWVNPRI